MGSMSGAWVNTVSRVSGPWRRSASATASSTVAAWLWPRRSLSAAGMPGEYMMIEAFSRASAQAVASAAATPLRISPLR